jgi:hydroxypyruvate reductase
MSALNDAKEIARDIFDHALKQTTVSAAFAKHIAYDRGILRVCEDLYELNAFARVLVISFGKAAHTMAEALAGQIGSRAQGIVAAPAAALEGVPQIPGFRYFAAGHPTPNEESIKAARAALQSISSLTDRALVIYLISGGGSSLLEQPIDADLSLDDLKATYSALVNCGAPIAEINAVRKHLSAVKGGRLARAVDAAAPGSQQVSIMISDVPDDALDSLASGPTMPDSTTVEQCYELAARYSLRKQLPQSVVELFDQRALEETPKKDDPCFRNSRWWTVLSNQEALKAAALKASEYGYAVDIDNSCDDQDYAKAADYLLDKVRKLRRGASRVCLISGGEVTVAVGEDAGTGGRNQQFALYCAGKIASERITVLSAGTDGIDGNSQAAGAVVDGRTLEQFSLQGGGQSLTAVLKSFDSAPVLQRLGSSIVTGPTGNNLRDLRILLAD